MRSSKEKGRRDDFSPPLLEEMEPRLLLTTMTAPVTLPSTDFVYTNSEEELVRVSLSNPVTGVGEVELMRWVGSDVTDMPGLLFDDANPFGTAIAGGLAGQATFTLNTDFATWPDPADVQGIGCDPGDGILYAYDNANGELWVVDTLNGQPVAPPVTVYDSVVTVFGYDITAMDVDASGTIYAVGTLVDLDPLTPPGLPVPAGPFLITIDPTTGAATRVNPTATVVAPGATVNDITFDAQGNLYGTDGTNLLAIALASGTSTIVAAFVDVANNNAAINNMTGLEFHGGTLYGQAGDLVYQVNVNNGDCTPLNGTLDQTIMTDLASDGTYLYGVFSENDQTTITIINVLPPEPADVFCVYVSQSDEYTVLTFSIIEEQDGAPNRNLVHLWDATPTAPLHQGDDNEVDARAPDGSGGVMIGAVPAPVAPDSNEFLHMVVNTHRPFSYLASALGAYPGGMIHAGVMSRGPIGEAARYEEWDIIDPVTGMPDVDLLTGEIVVLSTDQGFGTTVSSLAADSGAVFYAVDNVTHMLMEATYDPLGNPFVSTVAVGELRDAAEPSFRYDNVHALAFDSTDVLYGVATISDTVAGPPVPPTGTWLITIDTATGAVTRVAELNGATNISTIAFNASGVLYAVDADTDSLATIDPTTGDVTVVAALQHFGGGGSPEIEGIAFDGSGNLYGVDEALLYTIDPVSGVAFSVGEVGYTGMPALAFTPAYAGNFWTIAYLEGSYRLVKLEPGDSPLDMSRLLVAGTIAGQVDITGSLDVLEMGFLWGNVIIGHDLANMIVHTDVSAVPNPDDGYLTPENSVVDVGGTLRELDVYGTMYGSVNVASGADIPNPHDDMADLNAPPILELEPPKPSGDPDQFVPWATYGELQTVNNDAVEQAQFLFNESGSMIVWGVHEGYPDPNDRADFYSISLMAGQTIRVDAYSQHVMDPRFGFPITYDALGVALYDSDMNYMGSYGFERTGTTGATTTLAPLVPLTFTAPRAGIYHLIVTVLGQPELGGPVYVKNYPSDYTIFINNGTPASLGAVHVNVDYSPLFGGEGVKRNFTVAADGNNLGAIQVHGAAMGMDVGVFGGGDLVAFRGGSVGVTPAAFSSCNIVSHGNIGLLESESDLNVQAVAGVDAGLYNNNAYIQNVICAGRMFSTSYYFDAYLDEYLEGLTSSGSIGSVFVGSHVSGGVSFWINSDDDGPTGYLDQLDVRGDWGGMGTADPDIAGAPYLKHGLNADFRMVRVAGDVYHVSGTTIGQRNPVPFDDGTVSVIDDDGGGQIRISPDVLRNPDGTPVQVPGPAGRPVTVPTPYSYLIISVYEPRTLAATGAVLANLTMGGPGSVSLAKPNDQTDIGELNLTGPGDFKLTGTGALNVFYLVGADVTSLVNSTDGVIASANFTTSVDSVRLTGSLGRLIGPAGQWIWGIDAAPAGSEMGWFANRIHGIQVAGDIADLRVGGWLGDVLVTGRADDIRVNTDDYTVPAGLGGRGFEGVVGVVHVGSLGQINVGDGLRDDGTGGAAMAAILSDADIDRVLIDGPGRVLYGSILATGNILQVLGRNGAEDRAIVGAVNLGYYHVYLMGFVAIGYVGTVDFTGPGAVIDGAEVLGAYIEKIATSADSDGIRNSDFNGVDPPINEEAVGQVLAGGPGLYNCVIGAEGMAGSIRGVGSVADIWKNRIDVSDSLGELAARDVYQNMIEVSQNIGTLSAKRDLFGHVSTGFLSVSGVSFGSLDNLSVGRDFAGNHFRIAAELKSAKISGSFYESTLDFQGPYAKLGTLDVVGEISGRILSAGSIGAVISRSGVISAYMQTIANLTTGDVGLISALLGYTGELDVAGDLKKLYSYSSLGVDPTSVPEYLPKRFSVAGNVGYLGVRALRGSPPVHLYTTLYVGGDIGTLDVDGSLYADVHVNGSVGKLTLDGDMGGQFDLNGQWETLGHITVLGELGKFAMPASASVVGDLTTGGSISKITLKDRDAAPGSGNILGDITSLHGAIEGISLTNGVLAGNLSAATSIGKITLKGSAGDRANLTGDLIANSGGIDSIAIVNGDLDGDVTALAGGIKKVSIKDGSIVAGHTIHADGSIGSLAVRNGSLNADVEADAGVGKLDVKDGDLTGDVNIGADVKTMSISGAVNGATLWVNGLLKAFKAGSLTNATVSSLFGMDKVDVAGNVTGSEIIAGYNGATAALHGADVKSIKVGGNWTDSIVALGVDPVDGDFATLGDNLPAAGVSRLGKMDVRGAIAGAGNLVIADTDTGVTPAGVPTETVPLVPSPPPLSADPTHQFGEGTVTIGGVVITLKGPGVGSFDPATNEIVLNNTTAKSSLTVFNPGAGRQVTLVAGDDDSLSALSLSGDLQLGATTFDGTIGKFAAGAAAVGANWQLLGGVGSMVTGGLSNADIVMGELGSWKMSGGFQAGSLTVDAITKGMTVSGNLGASVATVAGEMKSLAVSGSVSGNVTSRSGIGKLTTGTVTGNVVVQYGDLDRMSVAGDLNGNVDVQQGFLNKLDVRDGSFASPVLDKAVRTLMGIGQFSLQNGVSSGLISTNGAIKKITVKNGIFRTRVRAGREIGAVTVDALDEAMLASATDIGKVTVRGDMANSDIVAGFDPGDAGYDAAYGGDAANVRIDGRTPAAWRIPGNADVVRGGDVGSVKIGGNMYGSSIAAGVSPGPDGWFGSSSADDQVRGVGRVKKVFIGRDVTGSGDPTEHYGVFAASGMPSVVIRGREVQGPVDNFRIDTLACGGGAPRVVDVDVFSNRIVVYFDHDMDFSTINTAQKDPSLPTTFDLVVSRNSTFGPAEPDDVSISDDLASVISYDEDTHSVELRVPGTTLALLNKGTHFRLTIDGSVAADRRGNLLDGEYQRVFPTGDGKAGGDFVYCFIHGDAAGSQGGATELTDGTPFLVPNVNLQIHGEIGDNLSGAPSSDVDVYKVDVEAGDVLYSYSPSSVSVWLSSPTPGLLVSTISGLGERATAAGEVYITVDAGFFGPTGPYTLNLLLFNDGNSNFTFDDPSQAATTLTWNANTAQPETADQEILAPDDVDVYSLGALPAYTELSLTLDALLIGSGLTPKMAVFNSSGDLVGNIIFGGPPVNLDVGGVVPEITLTGSALTPAADTYYVAVAGLGFADEFYLTGDYRMADMGKYRLTVTQQQVSAPVFPKQVVYVNFTGGVASFLAEVGLQMFGVPVDTYMSPLSATLFGFDVADTQTLINTAMQTIERIYTDPSWGPGLTNIEFTTVRPLSGSYSTVFVGGGLAPTPTLGGLAENIDTLNRDLSDDAAVWGGQLAVYYNAGFGYTLDQIGKVLGNLAGHELGHILGLNHVQGSAADTWLMGYGDTTVDNILATHEPLMYSPSYEFIIGYQNSVASLWPVA